MAEAENTDVPQPEKYYAAILHADGTYVVEEFAALDNLAARLRELIDRDVSVFTFAGLRLQISKPPFRHLLTPWGNLPLFTAPDADLEPDDSGYLGLDPIHLEDPPEITAPKTPRASNQSDDFFPEDTENVMNVFDSILPDPDS
jgi:hypothetical protein